MRIGFVGNIYLDKTAWIVNTAKKILESGNEACIELHELHEQKKTLDRQIKNKKIIEKETGEMRTSLHIPWEPPERYDLLKPGADVTHFLDWLEFAANIGAEAVNVHLATHRGIKPSQWKDALDKGKAHYLDTAGENLNPLVSKAENLGIKLTLENLMPYFYDEKSRSESVFCAGNFPDDFNYLREKFAYEFSVTPDVCHLIMTWLYMKKQRLEGLFPEDATWTRFATLAEFLSAWITKARPICEAHLADSSGWRFPSEHALTLGDGILGDREIESVLRALPRNAVVVLELKEDWSRPRHIEKLGYLPRTVKSLETLVEVSRDTRFSKPDISEM